MTIQFSKAALAAIFRNFGSAIAVVALPSIAVGILIIIAFVLLDGTRLQGIWVFLIGIPIIVVLIGMVLFWMSWIAVAWHRKVLLGGKLDFAVAHEMNPIPRYMLRFAVLNVLFAVVAVPVSIATFFGIAYLAADQTMIIQIMGPVVLWLIFVMLIWVWLRFAIILPGTAIGDQNGIFDGWLRSTQVSRSLFLIALFSTLAYAMIEFVVFELVAIVFGNGLFAFLAFWIGLVFLPWLYLLFTLSLLSVVYNHVFEGQTSTE